MTRRALSFGAAAETYERFRLGYPDQVAAEIFAYAQRPIRTAMEIGAGTGKATRLFASRGVAVTATEPDAAMIEELRKQTPESVRTVQASLEDVAPTTTYELVYAAAALHWTLPEQRWPRIAALLIPGGVFASFGGPIRLADPEVDRAVRAARSSWLADDEVPAPDGTPSTSPMQWPGTELAQSDLFTDVRQLTVERRVTLSARDYIGHLSTISAYLELAEPDRRNVLERIFAVLPSEVGIEADIVLHLARLVAYSRSREMLAVTWRTRDRICSSHPEGGGSPSIFRSGGRGP